MLDLNWMDAAACASIKGFTEKPIDQQRAVCATCPVRPECLGWGLDQTTYGRVAREPIVFGGATPEQLHKLHRRRARGTVAALQGEAQLQVTAQLQAVDERRRLLVQTVAELLANHETPAAIALLRAGYPALAGLFEAEYKRTTVVCDADARRVVS